MARPSSLQRRLAGPPEGRSGTDADRGAGDRPGQEQLQRGGAGRGGAGRPASTPAPGRGHQAGGRDAELPRGDGGLLRRPSPRSRAPGAGPPGSADVAGVRAALRQGAEERRSGRGGDRRGGDPADDAVCRAQERGAARHADAAPRPGPARGRAHGADQPAARRAAGARHHRAPGATQAGAAPRDPAGRGSGLAQPADPAAGRGPARRVARAGPAHLGLRRGVRRSRPARTRPPGC